MKNVCQADEPGCECAADRGGRGGDREGCDAEVAWVGTFIVGILICTSAPASPMPKRWARRLKNTAALSANYSLLPGKIPVRKNRDRNILQNFTILT